MDLEALPVTKICLIWEEGAVPSSLAKNPLGGFLCQDELCLLVRLVHRQSRRRVFAEILERLG